jgi:archaellum biogenesis ATPase FlaH
LIAHHFDIDEPKYPPIDMTVDPEDEDFPRGVTSLPMELEEFLSGETCSLLIKGVAGTGKTALALTILRALDARKNFFYLSTRASTQNFFRYFPWLKEWLADVPKKGKDQGETGVPAAFVDARLDEPTQLFERITGELMDASAPTIVIDTWDSLKEFPGGESLDSDMRVLRAWCERAHARLIVIKEDVFDASLDSVMEGVATLKQYEFNGRLVREIAFPKLSGVDMEHSSYLFTLKGGMFHAFEHYRERDFLAAVTLTRVITDAAQELPQTYSTGYRELDSVLGGGVPAGSLLNLELAAEVHTKTGLILLGGAVAATAKAGHRVLLFPVRGMDEAFAKNLVKNSVVPSRRKLISRFWPRGGNSKTGELRIGEIWESLRSAEGSGADDGLMAILGPEVLAPVDGGEAIFEGFVSTIGSGGAGIVVTREGDMAFSERLALAGAIRIRIANLKGTLLLEPARPMSPYLAAQVHRDSESATFEVEPMV